MSLDAGLYMPSGSIKQQDKYTLPIMFLLSGVIHTDHYSHLTTIDRYT